MSFLGLCQTVSAGALVNHGTLLHAVDPSALAAQATSSRAVGLAASAWAVLGGGDRVATPNGHRVVQMTKQDQAAGGPVANPPQVVVSDAVAFPAGDPAVSRPTFNTRLVAFEREPVTADAVPMRMYAAAVGSGGRVRLVAMRDRGLNPLQSDPVPLYILWSAEQWVAGNPALTGVEPVAVAVGPSLVVLVSTSGVPGNAVVTGFSKTDGSVLWTTQAIAPTAALSAFEPAGAAIALAEASPANPLGAPALLVGGTGTISGGARVPVVLGWSLQADPPLAVPIPGSPLLSQAVSGFRDEVTVAKPLLSGQEGRPSATVLHEGRPSAAVLGLGLAGTRVEIPNGTSDWFVRVAHVTNTQPPVLTWRWTAPTIVSFDAYDVPTDLCMGGWLEGDHSIFCGTLDKEHWDAIYVVGTSRATPTGPRTARLRTFKAQSGIPPLPTEQFLNGWFFREEGGVQQDVDALSIAYSANVMNQGSHTQGCDKRGVFVTGSIGPVGGPTQTIVMSWAGTLGEHETFPGSPLLHWPRWAAVPPPSIQGGGRVSDGGVVVVSPAPPVWGQIESDTVLHTIGSWTDTQGTTHWRLMRWKERPQP